MFEKLAKHAGQKLGIIHKAKSFLYTNCLATLYKAKVRSVMEYCGPIRQNASESELKKLDSIQHKACRMIGRQWGYT